jgi:hypothetical protein
VPTQDTWNEQLSKPGFWANRKSGGSSGWSGGSGLTKTQPGIMDARGPVSLPWPSQFGRLQRDDELGDGVFKGSNTYRTMCVRLCDGFYFPISFATTRDHFEADAAVCARNCGGPQEARLFAYRNPGGEVGEMEDLDGRAYKKLQTAFLFRTKYDAACKCRAHPWEEAAVDRHKAYALADAAQKGNKAAAQTLIDLKVKMGEAARSEQQRKSALAKARRDATLAEKAVATAEAGARKAGRRAAAKGTAQDWQSAPGPHLITVPQTRVPEQTAAVLPPPSLHMRPMPDQRRQSSRLGDTDEATAPAGGRASVVILRMGTRAPVEISVPVAARAPVATGLQ